MNLRYKSPKALVEKKSRKGMRMRGKRMRMTRTRMVRRMFPCSLVARADWLYAKSRSADWRDKVLPWVTNKTPAEHIAQKTSEGVGVEGGPRLGPGPRRLRLALCICLGYMCIYLVPQEIGSLRTHLLFS